MRARRMSAVPARGTGPARRARLAGGALVLALAAVGCGAGTSTPPVAAAPSASPSAPATTAPPATAAPVTATPAPVAATPAPVTSVHPAPLVVTIRNFAFLPQNPVLAPGQGVVIVNQDTAAHTWTAAPDSGWTYDSGNIAPGKRATFPGLTRPGRYPVLCLYHAEMPAMTGTVTVR